MLEPGTLRFKVGHNHGDPVIHSVDPVTQMITWIFDNNIIIMKCSYCNFIRDYIALINRYL